MMKYICDTAGAMGACARCYGGKNHVCESNSSSHVCEHVGHRVHCRPVVPSVEEQIDATICKVCGAHKANWREAMGTECHQEHGKETHTCYFCEHEGADVKRQSSCHVYVCDDGDACDERWQALEDDEAAKSLESKVRGTIADMANSITARIMELIA